MRADYVRILLVGGAASELCLAAGMAGELGADVRLLEDFDAALDALRAEGGDLVMVEVSLDVAGFIGRLRSERFSVPVLGCGVSASPERAVAAVRAGARDYVPLPPDPELIAAVLRSIGSRDHPLVGKHSRLRQAIEFARSLAASPLPLLIVGERGTGKESVAREVHRVASRPGRFIVAECAGLDAEQVVSELFGHAEGAFPGAVAARVGRFAEAARGTIFLRNIDLAPAEVQARLVPMIDARSTRVIAGSCRDPKALVAQGRLRADLLDRLAVGWMELPPLRERNGDIELLARHFAKRFADEEGIAARDFAPACLSLLRGHHWSGNVRELSEVVHRAVLLSFGERIAPADLLLDNGRPLSGVSGERPDGVEALVGSRVEEVERELILQTLARCGGNRTSASEILGISVRTMRNKLRSFTEAGYSVAPAA